MDQCGDGSACPWKAGRQSVTLEHCAYTNHVLCALRTHCMYSLCDRLGVFPSPIQMLNLLPMGWYRRWVGPLGGDEVTREITVSDPMGCSGPSLSTCTRGPGSAPWECPHGLPNHTWGNLSPRDPGRSHPDLHPNHSSTSVWLRDLRWVASHL